MHPVDSIPAARRIRLVKGLSRDTPEYASIPRKEDVIIPSMNTAMTPVISVAIIASAVERNIPAIFLP